ncbi:MAG: hypothetical protein NZ898_13090 [Myxococcota bacterium]|nr:hypothetical protein [Myxococcota bacterium]MDW8363756.1 hypothetical protein [Myxococcales bacterium]
MNADLRLRLLEALAFPRSAPRRRTVQSLARIVGHPESAVHRELAWLERRGLCVAAVPRLTLAGLALVAASRSRHKQTRPCTVGPTSRLRRLHERVGACEPVFGFAPQPCNAKIRASSRDG